MEIRVNDEGLASTAAFAVVGGVILKAMARVGEEGSANDKKPAPSGRREGRVRKTPHGQICLENTLRRREAGRARRPVEILCSRCYHQGDLGSGQPLCEACA